MTVDREGRVHHHGEAMTHAGVAHAFASGLDIDERGEAIVRIGQQWAYVLCERTPFVVVRARRTDSGLHLELNTGESVDVPATELDLRLEGDSDLYVAIHAGRHEARFGRTAWMALAGWLDADDGRLVLPLGAVRVPVEIEPIVTNLC